MKTTKAASLIVGLLAGAIVTAGIMLAVGRSTPPERARRPERPRPEADSKLRKENRRLREELAALQTHPASPEESVPEPSRLPPEVEPSAAKSLLEEFDTLVARETRPYMNQDIVAFILRLRKEGAKGRGFVLDKLRNGATAADRVMAATLLEGLGDPETLPELGRLLPMENDLLVRRMMSHAIAMIGTADAEAPLRTAMVRDTDWGVRVNSAFGLARLGDAEGLKYLEEAYLSTNTPAEYRLSILSGLAHVAAPTTAPVFRKILEDTPEEGYVLLAISALEKMKDVGSIPHLERVATSAATDVVKEEARKAIRTIRTP